MTNKFVLKEKRDCFTDWEGKDHYQYWEKDVENFLRVSTEELKDFARLTGNDDVHGLAVSDLCTTSSEISNHTSIAHV